MEKENSIILVGEKSNASSPFAVFETFRGWRSLREIKILPKGVYFSVLVLADGQTVDIKPDLFVQGYRPHSSGKNISVDRRRYGEFVIKRREEFKDDVVYHSSQLYKVLGEREVKLVLREDDVCRRDKISLLAEQVCLENGYERLSEIKLYRYVCPVSSGYFLAGRVYTVWSVLIGKPTGFSLEKKVLIFHFGTGIPAIVDYDDKCFEKI